MKYEINKELLHRVKENDNRCLCNINLICPCDDFLEEDECMCEVYNLTDE